MAWKKLKEFLDLRTGMHVVQLHDVESGAKHLLQVVTGHDSCPHCGHSTPKDNLNEIDTARHLSDEIASLEKSHANQRAYAAKHRVEIRKPL